ncbi:MAG: hypothetical protein ABI612_07550 [Betaproteobacteria bacterium]
MSKQLVITYYADRDVLGLVSDEDYEAFKDMLLEQLHKEWPKAGVSVDDGESSSIEVEMADGEFPTEKAEKDARADVEARVHEIAHDIIEEREWATKEFEAYDEDYEEDLDDRRSADSDRDDH